MRDTWTTNGAEVTLDLHPWNEEREEWSAWRLSIETYDRMCSWMADDAPRTGLPTRHVTIKFIVFGFWVELEICVPQRKSTKYRERCEGVIGL